VTLTYRDGALNIDFKVSPGMSGSLEHAKLQAISPLADFSFDYQDFLLKPVTR
jgi:hypothetical protein